MKTVPCIRVAQGGRQFFLANLTAGVVTTVSYASVRNVDREEGAVQRVLNGRRVVNIKDFAISGGSFPNSIVLNWLRNRITVAEDGQSITFEELERSAQLIDGQHRVEGLREAIKVEPEFRNYELPVAIYVGLTTKECADIFLAINTEQKPVHPSLVYDLYEVADDHLVDPAAARARDIAIALSEEGAPYYRMIKFPGEAPRKGGVTLSTVVNSIKPLVEKNGDLEQVRLTTFEDQSKVIINFFNALKNRYGSLWPERTNAFMYAAGFSGAIDFLTKRILPYCVQNKKFGEEFIRNAIKIDPQSPILQKDVSKVSGTEALRMIFIRLDEVFEAGEANADYEF